MVPAPTPGHMRRQGFAGLGRVEDPRAAKHRHITDQRGNRFDRLTHGPIDHRRREEPVDQTADLIPTLQQQGRRLMFYRLGENDRFGLAAEGCKQQPTC